MLNQTLIVWLSSNLLDVKTCVVAFFFTHVLSTKRNSSTRSENKTLSFFFIANDKLQNKYAGRFSLKHG